MTQIRIHTCQLGIKRSLEIPEKCNHLLGPQLEGPECQNPPVFVHIEETRILGFACARHSHRMSGESINVNDADKWCRRLFPITNKTLTLIDWDTLVEIDEQVWHQRISGVYFVQPKQGGPIKIGTTRSNLIENRISALQTGNPYPLILLRIVYGDVTVEHEIHRRLANYRLKGEWFIPTNEVLRYALGREVDDLHSWNKCQSDWTLGYREGFAAGREIGQQQGYSQGVHETSDLLKEIFSQSLQRAKGLKKQAFDQMYFSLVRENNNFQIDDEQKQTNLLNQFRGWRQTEEPA